MENYLLHLDRKLLGIVREAGREADRQGLSAYVVGGIVRDMILGNKNFDLDVLVKGNAVRLAKGMAKKQRVPLTVYKQFGTASLELPGGIRVDFATARKEHYVHSGALPTVFPGGLKKDLFRRDFTINAMAIAINADRFGQLVDEFGGLKDLSKGKIRVLHPRSFIDDPTRILRAVRFEQRFRFRIERHTLRLIKAALEKKVVANVKPQRYFAEFKKILSEPEPVQCLKRLHGWGGLRFLDPRLKVRFRELSLLHNRILKARQQIPYKRHHDWWLVYFIGLIAWADGRTEKNILKKFHFTKEENRGIQQSQKARDIIHCLSARALAPSRVYQILKPLTKGVIVYLRVRTSNRLVCRRIDRFLANDMHIKLEMNGEDLKNMGIASGCAMGTILESVLLLKIDNHVHTKREELNAARLFSGGHERGRAAIE